MNGESPAAFLETAREWKLRSELSGSEPELAARIAALRESTGLSTITLRVCLMRGLDTPEAIHEFLNPKFESLTSPLSIRDMDLAIERLSRVRREGQLVRVF